MKKLFVFSLLFLLGACAEGSIYKKYDQDCNDHFYSRKDCPAKEEKAKAPKKYTSTGKQDPSRDALRW